MAARGRLFVPSLSMVMIITALVSSLGTPLIPQMVAGYGVSLEAAQWVLTIPMLTGAILSPLIGRLGTPGRQRPLLLVCLGLVALGLLLSALPLGFPAMLAGRALQGIGLSLAPIAMAIASNALGAERALPTVANLSAASVAAAGLSFPLSSLFAGVAGVAGAYWVGLVLAIGTLVMVWIAVPAGGTEAEVVSIDWWGAAVLAGGSGALLLLLSRVHAWNGWTSLVTALLSAALVLFWVIRSLRIPFPLIDLRLAAARGVSLAHIAVMLAGLGTYLMLPLVIIAGQDEHAADLSPLFSGFLMIPYSVMSVLGSRIGNRLRGRYPLPRLLLAGSLCYIAANALLAFGAGSVWALLAGMAIAGIGSGSTYAVIPQLVVQQVPEESTSSALAFNMLLRYIGFSAGSALCPVLLSVGDQRATDGSGRYVLPFLVAAGFFVVNACVILLRGRTPRSGSR